MDNDNSKNADTLPPSFPMEQEEGVLSIKELLNLLQLLKEESIVMYNEYLKLNSQDKLTVLYFVKKEIIKENKFINSIPRKDTQKEREWRKILITTNGYCTNCKDYIGISKLTRDHIIPLSCGGRDVIENIQPLCLKCNIKKSDKLPHPDIYQSIIKKVGLKKSKKR